LRLYRRANRDGNPRQLTSEAPGTPYGLGSTRARVPRLRAENGRRLRGRSLLGRLPFRRGARQDSPLAGGLERVGISLPAGALVFPIVLGRRSARRLVGAKRDALTDAGRTNLCRRRRVGELIDRESRRLGLRPPYRRLSRKRT
jgi:hypothetical protein